MLVDADLEKARAVLLDSVFPLGEESVPLAQSGGRILSRDFRAPADVPPWAQSAVDGYALGGDGAARSWLLAEGSELEPGRAAAVVTGGPLPGATGAVVARERVRVEGDHILTEAFVSAGDNIKPAGEDIRAGEMVAAAGRCVDPGLIAVLAAFGQDGVYVRRRPRLGILSVGKGIAPFDAAVSPGQVRDANGPLLAALAVRNGAGVAAVETAGDDPGLARSRLEKLLARTDVVLTVGGAASGPDDWALAILKEVGARVLVRGVRIKPGNHTKAGLVDGRMVIMLSGNPAACAVGYQLLAVPVLRALQGLDPCPPALSAVSTGSFPKSGGPRRFLRGHASCGPRGWEVGLPPGQKSSMLSSLVNCNVLVELPAGHQPVKPGDTVSVIPLYPQELG